MKNYKEGVLNGTAIIALKVVINIPLYGTYLKYLNLFLAPISQTRNKIKALLNHFVPYERTLVYFLFVNF